MQNDFEVMLMYEDLCSSLTCAVLLRGNQVVTEVPLTKCIHVLSFIQVILPCFVHVLSFLVGSCAIVGLCKMIALVKGIMK